MVYIAYFTDLILQIRNYAQKRRIWRENCKYALEENFHCHFCSRRKAAKFCHPGCVCDQLCLWWAKSYSTDMSTYCETLSLSCLWRAPRYVLICLYYTAITREWPKSDLCAITFVCVTGEQMQHSRRRTPGGSDTSDGGTQVQTWRRVPDCGFLFKACLGEEKYI